MTQTPRSSLRIALIAALAPIAMFAMAYAAVPLYELFCRVTGYGGTTQTGAGPSAGVLGRAVAVRFDANIEPGLPIAFQPEARGMETRLGETKMAWYTLKNTSDQPVTLMATYNVTPHKTGIYFTKLQCFCFNEMVLQPREELRLPVVFYVDPRLDEGDSSEVGTITLSYTFHQYTGARPDLGGAT